MKPRIHKFHDKQKAESCRLKLMAKGISCNSVVRNGSRYEFCAIHPDRKGVKTVQWRFTHGIETARSFCEFLDRKFGAGVSWVGTSVQNNCITVSAKLPAGINL